jgi:hypothetical protein
MGASKRLTPANHMIVRPLSRRTKPAGWPIWLLFAAWFCVNSPQSLTYNVIVWTRGAQHFSHQERLKADVASILAGRKMPLAGHWEKAPSTRPAALPIPAQAVYRQIDLYAADAVEWFAPPARDLIFPECLRTAPDRARTEPLLTPPRSEVTA